MSIFKGGSKKRAKQHAAKQALIALIGSNVYQLLILESHGKTNQKPQQQQQQQTMECLKDTPEKLIPAHFINEDLINASEYDLTFSDYIARCLHLAKYILFIFLCSLILHFVLHFFIG